MNGLIGARAALSLFYAVAGAAHLIVPEPFIRIMPEIVPAKDWVVFLTGLCELAGAVGLQIRPLRRAAGIGLALYAAAVWPANWRHALEGVHVLEGWGGGWADPGWFYHAPRLALQPVLIWWALKVSR